MKKKSKKTYTHSQNLPASLEEPALAYQQMETVLGNSLPATGKPISEIDLISITRNGVKKSALKSLARYLGVSMDKMSALFHTSHRNLQRKDDSELLDVYKSGQAIEIAEVVTRALQLFGTIENLQQWMHSGLLALGGKKPFDLLDTSFGIRAVNRVLGRLEYGSYS